ncbi:tyrosine-type recombinase/integrase [Methylocapsa aurea]|uniref:tyrosine-type recombinase/integrase n=1 Tax=Methylocapsa aurea TaxID=663610 RepID=UPI0005600093|nr:tyrosine-type recombinase/integrase [Methylocapsa aurea]
MAGKTPYLINRQGNFWARIVVPKELRAIIGKTELREALGPNRPEAIKNLHAALVGFHAQLDDARRQIPNAPIPEKKRGDSIRALARAHYEQELAHDELSRRNYLRGVVSPKELNGVLPRDPYLRNLKVVASSGFTGESLDIEFVAATIGWAIDQFNVEGRTTPERGSPEWLSLARTLAAIQVESLERSKERDEGKLDGKPYHPILTDAPDEPQEAEPVSINGLFDAYIKELARSGKGAVAAKRWAPAFTDLVKFVGHDDATRLTKKNIVDWKDRLLESKSPKTVRDTALAALKAVLAFAAENDKIAENVAAGVKVRFTAPKLNRSKGFTPDEAAVVLKAALAHVPKPSDNPQTREGPHLTAAKKWVPWICAHSGARVAEITQLRKEDIRAQDGVQFIRITPEAGSVKTGKYRDVPIHPQLIELGFLTFVEDAADGPLFYATKTRTGTTHPSKTVAGRISQWLKSLNVVPPEVDPSHGWRHRFKTVGREAGIDPRVLDAIQGHAARTAGDNYGDVSLKASMLAIGKLPSIDLADSDG